jgi:nucleotide-binding universal stress UspA family protein
VGSRGRGQLGTLLLGSVSVAVVRHARCPVVVVRPENESTVRSGVLAGVDASPDSLPVLEFAYRQASLHDLRLTILDCTWDIQGGTMGAYLVADEMADLEGERLALAEAMAGMQEKYPDVHVTTRLGSGLPHEALVTSGDQMDLIVVGAHQKSRISHALFGSVSVSVVESATCPVAVVPLSVTD